MNTIEQFLAFAKAANAVTVDDSPVILDWESAPVTGEPTNEVFAFRWYEAGQPYGVTLIEKGLSEGTFIEPGHFVCDDSEGEKTTIRFFTLKLLKHPDTQQPGS